MSTHTVVPVSSIPRIGHQEAMAITAEENDRFHRLLTHIEPDQWHLPTDCTRWDVRDITVHVIATAQGAASLLEFGRQMWAGRPLTADEHVNWHIWGHAHHEHGPLWRSFLTEQRALVHELDGLTASLRSVTQPTLLIADPDDTLIPVGTTHQLAAALPDARVQLLSQTGHHLPRRGAPQIAAAITDFLAALDSRPAPA